MDTGDLGAMGRRYRKLVFSFVEGKSLIKTKAHQGLAGEDGQSGKQMPQLCD